MKRLVVWGFIALVMTAFLVTRPERAEAQEIGLKAATAFSSHTVWEKGFWMLYERVNKKAKGKMKINYVGGPEAIPPFELIEAVRSGVVDLVEIASSYYVPQAPAVDSLKLSRVSPQQEREKGALDLLRKINAEKVNCYYLGRVNSGVGFQFYTKAPLKTMADFKNLKLRVSPLYKPFLEALGGTPVMMAHAETYTALERGLVQGFAAGEIGVYEQGWHEHVKNIVEPKFYTNEQVILINLNSWNKLPKEMQQLLNEVMIEVEKESMQAMESLAKNERILLENAGVKGHKIEDADKYLDLAYEVGWKTVLEKDPKYGPELKKLLSK
ncbi:MAG: TRAP transporter substrate-binding protein DctP [Thermodesulfobacteriota bacterium]